MNEPDDQVLVESSTDSHQNSPRNSDKKNRLADADNDSPKSNPKSDNQNDQEDVSKGKPQRNCCFCKKRKDRNVYTISDIELTDVTEEEQQFLDQDWNDFKSDVSMKTLMDKLDRAIKRRRRLYVSDDEKETE